MELIYAIPLMDAFEHPEPCPLCRLYHTLEGIQIERVLGAGMMEPDMRIHMNHEGFCTRHWEALLASAQKLPLALILESHMAELLLEWSGQWSLRDTVKNGESRKCSCYVCQRVDDALELVLDNLFHLWRRDEQFRVRFDAAGGFCVPHAAAMTAGAGALGKKDGTAFLSELNRIQTAYYTPLLGDVTAFCQSFDHRSAGQPLSEDARTALTRAVRALEGPWGAGPKIEKR